MKRILLFGFLLISLQMASAQNNMVTSAEDSDPKAKAILDQIRSRFSSYKSLSADFALDITFPEQPTETQRGYMAKQGDKFKMAMASQTVISDGQTLWMIFDHNKEVQINDMPEEADMGGMILSPESLLNFYENGDFAYYITNEYNDGKRTVQQIEFKPLDSSMEYTKLRMNINKATKDVISVEAFGRDGSRYKLSLNKLTPNPSLPASDFTFDKADYPGYYIEDLRM